MKWTEKFSGRTFSQLKKKKKSFVNTEHSRNRNAGFHSISFQGEKIRIKKSPSVKTSYINIFKWNVLTFRLYISLTFLT